MDTTVTFNTIYEFDLLINTWQENIIHLLEQEVEDNIDNADYCRGIDYVYCLIKDLPYNVEYTINTEVMSK
ncbi:hypothetical protein ACF3N0_00320 [Moraxella atlantae]|uniref:hypothetical protein n=1 Tax=Faucicola atlantae TaxID=34059 RepID=UPI0037521785